MCTHTHEKSCCDLGVSNVINFVVICLISNNECFAVFLWCLFPLKAFLECFYRGNGQIYLIFWGIRKLRLPLTIKKVSPVKAECKKCRNSLGNQRGYFITFFYCFPLNRLEILWFVREPDFTNLYMWYLVIILW